MTTPAGDHPPLASAADAPPVEAAPAAGGDPAMWLDPPPVGRCWFFGCPNEVPQPAGAGRRAVVCGQTVAGLRHTRLNKSLLKRGRIQLPAPGGGAHAGGADTTRADAVKPVTTARATYGQVLAQVQATLAALPGLVERMETAARTVADQDSTASEIASVERGARAQIDAADTERDNALAAARAAQRAAADAETARAAAAEAAEAALEAEDAAAAERDTALAERAAARAAEQAALTQARDARAESSALREELTRTGDRAEALARDLAAARDRVEQLHGELTRTEQQRLDTATDRDRLAGELQQARAELAQQRQVVADTRAELATTTGQLHVAQERLQTEKTHIAERLADHRARAEHAEQEIQRLHAELDAQRGQRR